MDIVNKLAQTVDLLNEVDDYASTLTSKLSELDSKEQDLLHYIENNKINMLWCYRMVRQIKTIREARRKVKNDMELISRYKEMDGRIISGKDSRRFMMAELHKKEKQLQTTYKNRQYSEEDMQNILRGA